MAQHATRGEVSHPQLVGDIATERKDGYPQKGQAETIAAVSTRDTLDCVESIPSDEESTHSLASTCDSSGEEVAQIEVLAAVCIVDAASLVAEATAAVIEPLPVVQVGPWFFHGKMTVLHDGNASLANSVVRKGIVSSSARPSQRITVAIKAVSLQSDEESIAMIRRECVILRDIKNSHPHITPMLSCAELVSESVLLTPFASHGDLSQHVRIGCECLEERDVQRLTSQLMSALAHLHKRRIVHGDIMPKNVFLSEHKGSFLAQLGDFGLAARLPEGQDVIRLENMQGSHGYLPPQMIRHKELRPAGDLFALGVMTFQLLGAHDPFYPASQVWNKVEFDEVCWEPISDAARQFVIELLAVEPEVRGTANGFTRQWLDDGNGVHPCATRGSMSPKPAHDVHFHSLAEARSLWEAVKPQLGGYTN